MAKKNKPTDGLGPLEIAKIRSAIRQVWQRCEARKLVVKRCKLPKGYAKCEGCDQVVPKVYVDHIEPVGVFGYGFIERLFVPSHRMNGLCDECHKAKTKAETKDRVAIKSKG